MSAQTWAEPGWNQWACQSRWGKKSTLPQPYTKNYGQLRKAGSGRLGPLPGRTCILIDRPVPNNQPWKHNNIQAILYRLSSLYLEMCVWVCIHTYILHAVTGSRKEVMILKKTREGYMWSFRGRNVIIIS